MIPNLYIPCSTRSLVFFINRSNDWPLKCRWLWCRERIHQCVDCTLFLPFFSKNFMGLKSTIIVLYFPINNIKKGQIEKKVQGKKGKKRVNFGKKNKKWKISTFLQNFKFCPFFILFTLFLVGVQKFHTCSLSPINIM